MREWQGVRRAGVCGERSSCGPCRDRALGLHSSRGALEAGRPAWFPCPGSRGLEGDSAQLSGRWEGEGGKPWCLPRCHGQHCRRPWRK